LSRKNYGIPPFVVFSMLLSPPSPAPVWPKHSPLHPVLRQAQYMLFSQYVRLNFTAK